MKISITSLDERLEADRALSAMFHNQNQINPCLLLQLLEIKFFHSYGLLLLIG